MALLARGATPSTCADQGRRRLRGRGHRAGAPERGTPAARNRRPVDGRHERGRRPVRRRQDVPAPGGQVRPGDEKGGGLPAALHGKRKGRARHPGRGQRQDPDGHGKRRCARYRQEHRRRGAAVQWLRRGGPGRDGALRQNSGSGAPGKSGHRRPVRPDHPVPGRDGARGQRNGAPGHGAAADDRRRHHQPHSYRGEDRPQLPQPGNPRGGRLPRRGRRLAVVVENPESGLRGGDQADLRRAARTPQAAAGGPLPDQHRPGPRAPLPAGLGQLHAAGAEGQRPQGVRGVSPGRAGGAHRLDAVLPLLGTGRQVPAHPGRRSGRRGSHQTL